MTRHIRWQILLIVLGAVLVAVLLAYLALKYTTVLRPGYGGTYVEGAIGSPQYVNPLLSGYNQTDRDICALVFSGLTRMSERGEVVPDMARGWDVSPDGLTYTFYLRSNLFWHDGTPLTADDVLFTIQLLQDPTFPGSPDLGLTLWHMVTAEKLDRRTVRFTLAEPYAPFLDYTTVGIVPAHVLTGTLPSELPGASFNLNPIGSGPFQLEEIQAEEGAITAVTLKLAPTYYRDRPYIDRVQFRFYPSFQTALNAFEAGEVEAISRVPAADIDRARAVPNLSLFSTHMARYSMILLNQQRDDLPFFREAEVRQALLYAIDRQGIIDRVYRGYAIVPDSPVMPGTWAYKDDVKEYDYDPDLAEQTLNDAGWFRQAVGDRIRRKQGAWFEFTLLASSQPDKTAVAQEIAEEWRTLGISVTVQTASAIEVRQALEMREFDAILVDLTAPGDPDPYPLWHETQVSSGQNYSGFVHRRISEVIEQARVVNSRNMREELYYEFQDLFAEEVPALLLSIPVYTYGVDSSVNGVQIGPLTYPSDRFRTIGQWWIVPRRVFTSETEAGLP